MRTKFIRMFLCITLSVVCLTAVADSFTYNYKGIEFKVKTKGNEATIVGFTRNADRVVIPAEVQDKYGKSYMVSTLDLYSDVEIYKTTSVAIEKGIINIEEYCFQNFNDLQAVYIPMGIEKIGKKAFNKKHFPASCNMPPNIDEKSLIAGLAVYPNVKYVDPLASIRMEDYGTTTGRTDKKSLSTTPAKVEAGTSDVDYNIPTTSTRRENTYCVIIANENYDETGKVDYANIDGEMFSRYCKSTLGIPAKQVHLTLDADYREMRAQISWMKTMAEAASRVGKDINFIVYYAGHGAPSEDGTCYLMPVDGNPQKPQEDGYALKDIYNTLSSLGNSNTLMLVDACYSGTDRSNASLYDGSNRGTRRVKSEKVHGNVVVMSAASNAETSMSYAEKGHGIFTYFLLKKLQETKGNVSYGELHNYIYSEVLMEAANSGKTQTPSVTFSDQLTGSWKDIKF